MICGQVAQSGPKWGLGRGCSQASTATRSTPRDASPCLRAFAPSSQGAHVCNWIDGCLAIFPRDDWEQLAGRVRSLGRSPTRRARDFPALPLLGRPSRSSSTARAASSLPPASRVRGPGRGRRRGRARRDRIELWAPDRWASYSAGMADPDVLAAHLPGWASSADQMSLQGPAGPPPSSVEHGG